MTTKPRIIAEDVLSPSLFLSASEQEGYYVEQPDPDDDNSGSLRPISIGSDFSLAMDCTLGSGDCDTIFPFTGFDIYGDDYFIGCTMKTMRRFADSGDTGHNIINNGVTGVSFISTIKRFGNQGMQFGGGTDHFTIADHANWDIQAIFNLELWVKHTDHAGTEVYMGQYQSATSYWQFRHVHGTGLGFNHVSAAVTQVTLDGGEITDSDWHHVLMSKDGDIYGLYLDGIQTAYVSDSDLVALAGELEIGRLGVAGNPFEGVMDEIRIYHGNPFGAVPNAGLTDTITIPTEPHESDSDTKLLLHGDTLERTITDSVQDGGRLTVSTAFPATLSTGEQIRITNEQNDVDFDIELTTGGDIGDAKFKWSHDGGTTYLGRNTVATADWLARIEVDDDNPSNRRPAIVQAQNGDLLVFGADNTDYPFVRISSDEGITWGSRIEISTTDTFTYSKALLLSSGRILFVADVLYYSDDNGLTWSDKITTGVGDDYLKGMVELENKTVLLAYNDGTDLKVEKSIDGGLTWSALSTISSEANDQADGHLIQAKNGDVICAYVTDEDSVGDDEIKCKISTDGGVTWGAAIDVIDFTDDFVFPDLALDIDGTIFLVCEQVSADKKIVFTYSDDNGATWDVAGPRTMDLIAEVGNDLRLPSIALVDNQLICVYFDIDDDSICTVRRGMWEKFQTMATNACYCAIESYEQNLIYDVKVKWAGYAGIEEDKWDFGLGFYFAKENILLDSPAQPWRSIQDDIETSIVIDLEASKGHPFDGVGLFGCNVRTMKIQASPVDEDQGWELPPVDEEISFDVDTTGVIDSIVNDHIEDAALLANYKDHELRNHYIRMTSGTANGETYKIVDNIGKWFEVLFKITIKASVGDTFAIYKTDISGFFTDPDTTEWADVGSMEIGSSNAIVQNQDIVGSLTLNSTASTNNLARIIVGGNVHCATGSTNNFILGLQCTGTITDNGTGNVIEEGGWFDYPYRYIRILIETQDTYEGYYQIGNMVLGKYTELTRNWRVGYNLDSNFGIEMIRTPYGGLSSIRKHDEIKRFNLSWHEVDDTDTELTKLIDYIGGKNICLVPDGDNPSDCYLTKFAGTIKRRHTLLERFNTSLVLEEVP